MSNRDIIVKASLTADEYLALCQVAEEEGLSHSSLIRMLVKSKIRTFVMHQLSDEELQSDMPDTAPKRAIITTINPAAGLPDNR